jgi:hypothetical protein
VKRKHKQIIEHLLRFYPCTPTEQQMQEYIDYQSTGKKISKDNPLLDCQKWKEWVIASLIEEAYDWWTWEAGWIYPLAHTITSSGGTIYYDITTRKFQIGIENAEDPIMLKAVKKIVEGIEEKGMYEYYTTHPSNKK